MLWRNGDPLSSDSWDAGALDGWRAGYVGTLSALGFFALSHALKMGRFEVMGVPY